MPVHEVSPGRYRWGTKGKVYSSRAAAARQGRAAYANGYREDQLRKLAKHLKASTKAETNYVIDVGKVLGGVHAAAMHIVHRELRPDAGTAAEPGMRHDAGGMPGARRRLGMLWGQMASWVRHKVDAAFGRMSADMNVTAERGAALIGIPRARVPGLPSVVDAARAENVALITNASRTFLEQVRQTLEEHEDSPPEQLSKALQERVDVSKSRGQLIARDQTLKLNAAVNAHRQQSAGVTKYRWSTSQDERVRPGHQRLNGKVFSWDDPPETNEDGDTNNPGEDFQCRCIGLPFIEELESEPDDEPADDDG